MKSVKQVLCMLLTLLMLLTCAASAFAQETPVEGSADPIALLAESDQIDENEPPAAPDSLKVSAAATTALKLIWRKVDGATGYVVYLYNAKTQKYKKLASVKSNTFKATELKAGTTYSFAVRAYRKADGKNLFSDYSPILAASTKPVAPTVTAKAGTDKVKLMWNKVNGATGYVVYCSTSKKNGYKKLGTTKKLAYAAKNLDCGKTYYFKVRAFKKVNGDVLYGGDSAPVAAKTSLPSTVYVTRTGKKYHLATCEYLNESRSAITLKDAIENGYTPCSKCIG